MVTPLGKRRDVSDVFAIIVGSVPAGERTIVLDVARYTVVTTRRSMD